MKYSFHTWDIVLEVIQIINFRGPKQLFCCTVSYVSFSSNRGLHQVTRKTLLLLVQRLSAQRLCKACTPLVTFAARTFQGDSDSGRAVHSVDVIFLPWGMPSFAGPCMLVF